MATGTADVRRRVRSGAAAGMIAAVLFVVVFTLAGWQRQGYHPRSMFVSELSLGPYGWIQILNFVITGVLVFTFGRGLAAHFREGPASKAGPILMQIIGVSLLASGPFRTDPSAMFSTTSLHGIIHGVFGAVVFALAPVSCFVFYRRFRGDPDWRRLAACTLTAGIALALGIGLLKISQLPQTELFAWKGLIQRAILITFMAWLFIFAARLYRQATP